MPSGLTPGWMPVFGKKFTLKDEKKRPVGFGNLPFTTRSISSG
jgi:hypothetical protein